MKIRRLPPLHALQAFGVAARRLSFRAAAAELHLTPSAVSHQIRALEAHLGFALFRRLNRALELTEGGRAYLAVVEDVLAQLAEGGRRATLQHAQRRILRISAGPFFANEIILPALPSFERAHPAVELRIATELRPVDLRGDEVDVALRFGDGRWPGVAALPLLSVAAVPVCAPRLARALRRNGPGRLEDFVLIHSSPMPEGWRLWSTGTGTALGRPRNELWLDSYVAILRAAEQGVGLALGLVPAVNPWLRRRRLALPWPELQYDIPQRYYLLHRPEDGDRPEVQDFAHWLQGLLAQELGSHPNALR